MTNLCNCPFGTPTDRDYEENDELHCGYCKGFVRALHPAPVPAHRTAKRKAIR